MFQQYRAALLSLAAIPVAIAGFSSVAEAGTITLHSDQSRYTGNIGGGEFGATAFSGMDVAFTPAKLTGVSGAQDTVFQTFCVEGGASLPLDTSLNWTLSNSINNSGTPIHAQTAYLFTQFWNGVLTGPNYNYTLGSGRTSSANDLQEAIWYFEGFFPGGSLSSNAQSYVNQANTAVAAGGSWFGKGIGDVRVLVLTDSAGNPKQDVLVLLSVPLPPAALLGLGLIAGLGAITVVRRRRSLVV